MPEAIKYYAETRDYTEVREIHREILRAYLLDFAKHTPVTDIPKLSLIWESIPSHLARENKKFVFSAVRSSARSREYENAASWLEDAGLIYKSKLVSSASVPLKGYWSKNTFKTYSFDVGLLGKYPYKRSSYKGTNYTPPITVLLWRITLPSIFDRHWISTYFTGKVTEVLLKSIFCMKVGIRFIP